MNMRRGLMLAAAFVTLTASGLAAAGRDAPGNSEVTRVPPGEGCGRSGTHNPNCKSGNGGKSVKAIPNPEIDGAGALTAIALLGGVLTLVGERRRRKS